MKARRRAHKGRTPGNEEGGIEGPSLEPPGEGGRAEQYSVVSFREPLEVFTDVGAIGSANGFYFDPERLEYVFEPNERPAEISETDNVVYFQYPVLDLNVRWVFNGHLAFPVIDGFFLVGFCEGQYQNLYPETDIVLEDEPTRVKFLRICAATVSLAAEIFANEPIERNAHFEYITSMILTLGLPPDSKMPVQWTVLADLVFGYLVYAISSCISLAISIPQGEKLRVPYTGTRVIDGAHAFDCGKKMLADVDGALQWFFRNDLMARINEWRESDLTDPFPLNTIKTYTGKWIHSQIVRNGLPYGNGVLPLNHTWNAELRASREYVHEHRLVTAKMREIEARERVTPRVEIRPGIFCDPLCVSKVYGASFITDEAVIGYATHHMDLNKIHVSPEEIHKAMEVRAFFSKWRSNAILPEHLRGGANGGGLCMSYSITSLAARIWQRCRITRPWLRNVDGYDMPMPTFGRLLDVSCRTFSSLDGEPSMKRAKTGSA